MPITSNVFTTSPAVDVALPSADVLRVLHLRRKFGISGERAAILADIAFAVAPCWRGAKA